MKIPKFKDVLFAQKKIRPYLPRPLCTAIRRLTPWWVLKYISSMKTTNQWEPLKFAGGLTWCPNSVLKNEKEE